MRRLDCLFAGTLIVAAAGCGGSASSGSSPERTSSVAAAPAAVWTITVVEREFSLSPNAINLPQAGTVVFRAVNKGTLTHALAVEGHGVDVDSAQIAPGASKTLKVTLVKGGTYEFYCPVDNHKQQGMEGKLTVGGTAAGGMTTQEKGKTTTGGGRGY